MTDQERLQKIVGRDITLLEGTKLFRDWIWLKEQARRVLNLKSKIEPLLDELQVLDNRVMEEKREKERYKQALERARNMLLEMSGTPEVPMHPTSKGAFKVFEVLDKALEGESS